VVDRLYSDPELAALYDTFGAGRRDVAFYMPLVMAAPSVLDVGCGTGALLHAARAAGHRGRLCGLDPAAGMLQQARQRSDIEWILGDLNDAAWDQPFELVLMTGHVFQVFVEDDKIRSALAATRRALTAGGRFAFETRNPQARAWETWTPAHVVEIVDAGGVAVRMSHEVNAVEGERVSFTTTYTSPAWNHRKLSHSTLRFLGQNALSAFLSDAGFVVEEQYGYWDRRPVTDASPEIITIARRSAGAGASLR
jgi:ubiquinone/menaquinone biosynthesis C-methylase UbiE